MKSNVVFLRAASPQQKLSLITETVEKLFLEGKRIQILAPNDASLNYIDDLLWAYKAESFLPHAISASATPEPLIITKSHDNLNKADILFNLLPTPPNPAVLNQYAVIYDLLDETTPEKKAASEVKSQAYSA